MKHERCGGTVCGGSRRQFLRTLGTLAAGAILSPRLLQGAAGQAAAVAAEKPFRIDVHFHVISPAYLKRTRRFAEPNRAASAREGLLTQWTPAVALEAMDKGGIARGMLSIAVGGISFGKDEATRTLLREDNEFAAKVVRDYPGRFGQLAALPLLDLDTSLKEIEYTLDTLKADGIALVTSYGDKWLGDPLFAPAFEELNRRKTVVFVHPSAPACCGNLVPSVPDPWVEFDFDTTRTFNSMLVNGTLLKYPEIKFIFTHSGGALPALSGRIAELISPKLAAIGAPKGVEAEVRKVYFDIANAAYPSALDALVDVVPVSQILFGTDYPFVTVERTVGGLNRYTKLSKSDLEAVNRGNAMRLFPRIKG